MLDQRALPAQDECSIRVPHPSAVSMNQTPSKRKLRVLVWFLQINHLKCFPFHSTSYTRQYSPRQSSLLFLPKHQRERQQYSPFRIEKKIRRYSKLFQKDDSGKKQENSLESSPDLSCRNASSPSTEQDNKNYEVEELEFIWEVGDVHQDLYILEQAINFSLAEDYLQETERMEMLDEFAAQRRLVLPDVHHFVTRTLRISAVLVLLKRFLNRGTAATPIQQALYRSITVPLNIHFWVIVVAAPIIFLKIKQWTMPPPPPMPREFQDLGAYQMFIKPDWWEDPNTSCNDYLLCLLEQWTSAVKGFVFLTLFRLGFAAVTRLPSTPMQPMPVFSDTILAIVQLVTRLGAMVSLFQYPKLLFQLRRKQQPRPLKLDVTVLQSLVKCLFRWGIPLGLASDISQALVRSPPRLIIVFYGTVLTILSSMEILYNQQRKPNPPKKPSEKLIKIKRRILKATLFTLSSAALIKTCGEVTMFLLRWYKNKNYFLSALSRSWLPVVAGGVFIAALVGPLCHLIAFIKLIRVVYMHDLSLSDPDAFHAKLSDPKQRERLYNWRYRLTWREPQRMSVVSSEMRSKLTYWLFLAGSVEAKLYEEEQKASKKRVETESEYQKIWNLEKREMEMNPNAPKRDRTQWKQQAIDRLADIYQKDYEANHDGHTFRDPLGVAVQQRLGIGLGLNFDHTRKLKEGEKPSVRRLQARAAKSAVQRATTIYEERIRRTKELKNATKDAKEFGEKRIFDETEAEIQYLAKRLSDLIPPSGSFGPNDGVDLRMTLLSSRPKITLGENTTAELVLPSQWGSRSKAIDSLMGTTYEVVPPDDALTEEIVEEFNRMQQAKQGNSTRPEEQVDDLQPPDEHESILSDDEKDEFVEAFLRQKFGGGGIGNDDEGDDDDMKTYLA